MAAEQGCVRAQYNLALSYYNGMDTLEKNLPEAFKWLKLSADQGDSDAQLLVGKCLWNGTGVDEDLEDALRYLRWAASQGDQTALQQLVDLGINLS
jgi:TPR repeat protein